MQSVLLIGIAVSISLFTSVYAEPQNKNTKLNLNDLDINADGVISFLEFQESDKNGLSGLDLDMNGVLTLEEVLKSKPKSKKQEKSGDQEGTRSSKIFQRMDTNFDNVVTLPEYQDAKFDGMDLNKDGVLSEEDIRKPYRYKSRDIRAKRNNRQTGNQWRRQVEGRHNIQKLANPAVSQRSNRRIKRPSGR